MSYFHEQFLVDCCVRLFMIQVFCNRNATRIHVLITMRTVGNQFHCCCNNTGIEVFISLQSSVNSRLYKVVWEFHRNSLNESLFFVPTKIRSKVNNCTSVLIDPFSSSMLEINIRRRWDNNFSLSARSCKKGPIFCLHTIGLWKDSGKLAKYSLRCCGTKVFYCT